MKSAPVLAVVLALLSSWCAGVVPARAQDHGYGASLPTPPPTSRPMRPPSSVPEPDGASLPQPRRAPTAPRRVEVDSERAADAVDGDRDADAVFEGRRSNADQVGASVVLAAGVLAIIGGVGGLLGILIDSLSRICISIGRSCPTGPGPDYRAAAVILPIVAAAGIAATIGGAIWLRRANRGPDRAESILFLTPMADGAALVLLGTF